MWDPQVRGHGQHSGVEGHVAAGAGGQAVPRVQALAGRAVLPRLDLSGQQHPPGHARGRAQAAEDTQTTAVGRHIQRENVLPDAGRGQDDPFGISVWPVTLGGATGNLIPQGTLEYRRAQLVLAEEGSTLEGDRENRLARVGNRFGRLVGGGSAETPVLAFGAELFHPTSSAPVYPGAFPQSSNSPANTT
jgi:hypothetical protein